VTSVILAFILGGLGLILGSFLGLVSLRLPRGEGIVAGRSRCGGCGRPLPPWRLVPLLSWLVARGRCRDCGASIPLRYPLIESACALIGVGAALSQPGWATAIATALLGWQLLLIAIVDGENFWLPDGLTLPLLASGLAVNVWLDPSHWSGPVIGAVAGFVALWSLGALYKLVRRRDGLGGGDPILLAAGGAWVGWVGLPSVLIWASVGGLSVVAALMLTGRPVSGSDRMPFGVYLALGIALTWLLGPLGLSA
jgi:leader peptidase (prepilin peptidase)/N-methyltransferase